MFEKIEKSALNSHQKAMLKSIYTEILKALDLGMNIKELDGSLRFLSYILLHPSLAAEAGFYEIIELAVLNSRQKRLLKTLFSEILKALELGLRLFDLYDSINFFNANLEFKIKGIRPPKYDIDGSPTLSVQVLRDRMTKKLKELREYFDQSKKS